MFPQRKTTSIVIISSLSFLLLMAAAFFSRGNLPMGLAVLFVPFVLVFLALVFYSPRFGFWVAFTANYFVMGISRYLPGPLGLTVDALLVLTWLSVFFSQFNHRVEWKKAANALTFVSVLWFLYALFELFNPEAASHVAWFYAMRGVSLYMMLTVPLVFLVFNQPKHMQLMLKIWAWFTLAAVFKGFLQKTFGPDPWEHYWLLTVGGKTHLLPQGLRVFSFFTDAATYGGSMGFSGVVFAILAIHNQNRRIKYFYGFVAVSAFYAMFISGTRGALAVPLAGFTIYALLTKRIKIMIIGGFAIFTVFALLKFTTIGNNVYEIRRFRGGLDKNNDSFQVRLENQRKLKAYLASRPFGGGIGSAGNWGLRFSPGTFLAQTPTDSWYVQIWAEQGYVGLFLHLMILLFVVGRCSQIILFKLHHDKLKSTAIALTAGMVGIMAASYGSGALGQMPNGMIVYMSMAFVFLMPEWEKNKAKSTDCYASPPSLTT